MSETKVEEKNTEEVKADETKLNEAKQNEAKLNEAKQNETKANEKEGDIPSIYLPPYVDPSVERKIEKKKLAKKVWGIVALVLAIVYVGGVLFFSKHYAANTYVNGKNLSFENVAFAESVFDQVYHEFSFNVSFLDETKTFTYGDGSMSITLEKPLNVILKEQNAFLWPYNLFVDHSNDVPYSVSWDEKSMRDYLDTFDSMQVENMIAPTDAFVKLKDGEAIIVKDKLGTTLDKDKVYETVTNGISSLNNNINIMTAGCYVPANVVENSDEIVNTFNTANDFLAIDAHIMIGDYAIPIEKEQLTQMVYVDENGHLAVSENNIALFASDFVEKHNTVDTDRVFKTHDNKEIMIHGKKYGWKFDEEKLIEDLSIAMNSAVSTLKGFSVSATPLQSGYAYCNLNDIGDSYVEIDLSNQHVYLYVEGELVHNADVVTGNVRLGHNTPGGLFGLTYKAKNTVLVGADYASPVSYWMPFNGGIGMHDASWRSKFGGEIYKTDGSHGCVNMYISDAATIYDYVESGFPVVCYWRNEE